jgi:DNA modification methylase
MTDELIVLRQGDARDLSFLPDATVQCCITSPPYWGLRDYGLADGIGLEKTPEEYVANIVQVFREVWRVLRDDGTLWMNLGDCYAGSPAGNKGERRIGDGGQIWENKPFDTSKGTGLKQKDLCGIPWRVAFALQADGWYLRSDIIWAKPNPMPESVTDRPTKSHEYLFLMSKRPRYYYDAEAIREPNSDGSIERFGIVETGQTRTWNTSNNKRDGREDGTRSNEAFRDYVPYGRNRRDVWFIATQPYKGAHFATYPEKLVEPCVLAGSKAGDVVLDPFCGSGTTGVVAKRHNRKFIGVDMNADYLEMARKRIESTQRMLAGLA